LIPRGQCGDSYEDDQGAIRPVCHRGFFLRGLEDHSAVFPPLPVRGHRRSRSLAVQLTEDEIRDVVLAKARDLEIPISPQQIKIRRSQAGVEIEAAYSEYVDLVVRPITLNFSVSSKNKRI
jgi:hypothetical protein